MAKLMKSINVVSRCHTAYTNSKLEGGELTACHTSFVFAICREPGMSQEELAREVCLNKSTVARTLNYLEERGYVRRSVSDEDRRVVLVYPTEKLTEALPAVRKIGSEWNRLISEDIDEEEFAVFRSVLYRLESRAKELAGFSFWGGGGE